LRETALCEVNDFHIGPGRLEIFGHQAPVAVLRLILAAEQGYSGVRQLREGRLPPTSS
jgi:hypothetical protein